MTFEDLMKEAEPGDLLFFGGERWWSKLIKLRTWSRWSHVGMVVDKDNEGRVLVCEALEGYGVRTVDAEEWMTWKGSIGLGEVLMRIEAKRMSADYMLSQVGMRYASPRQFIRSFSFLWRRIAKFIGLPADTDANRWFCSELVAAAIQSADQITWKKKPAKMQPGDLAESYHLRIVGVLEYPYE